MVLQQRQNALILVAAQPAHHVTQRVHDAKDQLGVVLMRARRAALGRLVAIY